MKSIGRKIIRLESVDSTNNYTANLIKGNIIDHGTVILADEQFAGKGQRNAEWLSNPGENLTFSVFLSSVNLSVERQFVLTQFVSISLVHFFKQRNIEAKIKWPNDIYVGENKIAGILIENQLNANAIKNSIVGIGLNVNQVSFNGINATSLKLCTSESYIPHEVLFEYIGVFNELLDVFWLKSSEIDRLYSNLLLGLGMIRQFIDSSGEFNGTIVGVTESGKIRILVNEEERNYDLKEIQFLMRSDSEASQTCN